MKNKKLTIIALGATALLGVTGCGAHGTKSRMTTSSTHGRQLEVVIDGRATFQTRGGEHVVAFAGHELVVGSQWLVVDRDAKSFGIPPTAKEVKIEVSDDVSPCRQMDHC